MTVRRPITNNGGQLELPQSTDSVDIPYGFSWSGTQFDTTGTGSLNDYALDDGVTEIQFNSAVASIILKGLAGGYHGRMVRVVNFDASVVFLVSNNQSGSLAANRILCHGSIQLAQYDSVLLRYDAYAMSNIGRWLVVGKHFTYLTSDLSGDDTNPTIGTGKVVNAKLGSAAVTYDKMNFTGHAVANVVSSDVTIPSGYSLYVPDYLEVANGITLETADGAQIEVG